MSAISVRLPRDIELALDQEAKRSARNRSELVREAVGEYLDRRHKQRLLEEMAAAARLAYSDRTLRAETERLQSDFDEVDSDASDHLDEVEDQQAPDSPWWQ